jgi:hypothetical protein
MDDLYILDGTIPQRIYDEDEWHRWHDANSNVVASEKVGDVEVETLFLGFNLERHGGPPRLFSSMIIERATTEMRVRWIGKNAATWDEAVACHDRAVEIAEAGLVGLALLKRAPN